LNDQEPSTKTGLPWHRFSLRSCSQSRSETSEASASTMTKTSGCSRRATCNTKRSLASGDSADSTQESTIAPETNESDPVPRLSWPDLRPSPTVCWLSATQDLSARSIGRNVPISDLSIRSPLVTTTAGKKKPTWSNPRGVSTKAAYFWTSPPPQQGCSSPSLPI
jgi:hypothetical protein